MDCYIFKACLHLRALELQKGNPGFQTEKGCGDNPDKDSTCTLIGYRKSGCSGYVLLDPPFVVSARGLLIL